MTFLIIIKLVAILIIVTKANGEIIINKLDFMLKLIIKYDVCNIIE